jgi:hypothetical protein
MIFKLFIVYFTLGGNVTINYADEFVTIADCNHAYEEIIADYDERGIKYSIYDRGCLTEEGLKKGVKLINI